VSATSGELLGEQTVVSGAKGAAELLRWARELGEQRVGAIEDCRHVWASVERFLIERGERVLRVHSTLAAGSRRQARGRGKSDSIDALAIARAALREGLDTLPAAHLDGPDLDLRLLVDHRERLVRARVAVNTTLQWHLHDLWPDLEIAPHLLTEPGFGPLTAAKLVGEIAGADRFTSDAKLARAAGIAPIPVSSGNTRRHRLDRGGNRQINATIHPIAVTRLRCHPETQDYIARTRAEGKSTKDAIRCLKAPPHPPHLAPAPDPGAHPGPTITPTAH
jgi:transposase